MGQQQSGVPLGEEKEKPANKSQDVHVFVRAGQPYLDGRQGVDEQEHLAIPPIDLPAMYRDGDGKELENVKVVLEKGGWGGGRAVESHRDPYMAPNPTPLASIANRIARPVTGGEGRKRGRPKGENPPTRQCPRGSVWRARRGATTRPPSWTGQSTDARISRPDGPPCRRKKGRQWGTEAPAWCTWPGPAIETGTSATGGVCREASAFPGEPRRGWCPSISTVGSGAPASLARGEPVGRHRGAGRRADRECNRQGLRRQEVGDQVKNPGVATMVKDRYL